MDHPARGAHRSVRRQQIDETPRHQVVEIVEARTDSDYVLARELIEEYAATLGVDLCFQGLSEELETLSTLYSPPHGCFLFARSHDKFVGSVAVRAFKDSACELKRLYIRPQHRGLGAGRALTEAALERARALGYAEVVLDTLHTMTEAQKLYASLGFAATDPYYANPLPGVRYMRLELT